MASMSPRCPRKLSPVFRSSRCRFGLPTLLLGVLSLVPVASAQDAPFVRGDANADGKVNIADSLAILRYLFLGEERLRCLDAADAEGDGRKLDVGDALFVLRYLLLEGPPFPRPYPRCGQTFLQVLPRSTVQGELLSGNVAHEVRLRGVTRALE